MTCTGATHEEVQRLTDQGFWLGEIWVGLIRLVQGKAQLTNFFIPLTDEHMLEVGANVLQREHLGRPAAVCTTDAGRSVLVPAIERSRIKWLAFGLELGQRHHDVTALLHRLDRVLEVIGRQLNSCLLLLLGIIRR